MAGELTRSTESVQYKMNGQFTDSMMISAGDQYAAIPPRHLLVLCHDLIDAQFDRRITQQAAVWIDRGWDVTIVGMTQTDGDQVERWPNGVMCIKIDQRYLRPVHDPLWLDLLGRTTDEIEQAFYDHDTTECAEEVKETWHDSDVESDAIDTEPGGADSGHVRAAERAVYEGEVGQIENVIIYEMSKKSGLVSDADPDRAHLSVRDRRQSLFLPVMRLVWKSLPLSCRVFGWKCRAKLNFRTRLARVSMRCRFLWSGWRQRLLASCTKLRRFCCSGYLAITRITRAALYKYVRLPRLGWGVRTRLARIAAKQQIATPMAITSLLEWYPLPFTESLLQIAAKLRPDAILACDLTTVPAGLQLSINTGALLVYDSHEFYPEQISFSVRQRALLRDWDIRALNSAFLTYTVSPAIADLMQERYNLQYTPYSLSNAPDFQTSRSRDRMNGPLRNALHIGEASTVILYHGGFSRVRNLDVLIAGFVEAKLPDTRLVLLGYGERAWIDRLITEAGGTRVVHILDAVPASVLDRWIADANFVVIPYSALDLNTEYCSPNKLHDCIALGIPVLANRQLRDVSNLLEKFQIGLSLDMASSETLASSLLELSRFKIGQADFSAARAAFGWDAQRGKIESWISKIETELDIRAAASSSPCTSPSGAEAVAGGASR